MPLTDTPSPSRHHHRPVVTMADKVALVMAEHGRATSEQIAALLGVKATYVRSTMARIRRQLGPQAR